jgi:hypothetical protein
VSEPISTIEQLVAARQARGLGSDDMLRVLKIAPRQLESLEHGDWAALPGTPFVRGVLRAYARALEVDITPLLDTVGGRVQPNELKPAGPLDEPLRSRGMLGFGSGGSGHRLVWVGLVLLGVLAFALFFGRGAEFAAIPSWFEKRGESSESDAASARPEAGTTGGSKVETISLPGATTSTGASSTGRAVDDQHRHRRRARHRDAGRRTGARRLGTRAHHGEYEEAAAAVPKIREQLLKLNMDVPLVGDFHYNGHKLLTDIPACAEALPSAHQSRQRRRAPSATTQFAPSSSSPAATTSRCASASTGAASTSRCWRASWTRTPACRAQGCRRVMREALVTSALESRRAKAEEYGLAGDRIILSAKVSSVQDLIAVYRDLAALRLSAASGPDRGRHGQQGHRGVDRGAGGAAAGRHRRHHPRVADARAGRQTARRR